MTEARFPIPPGGSVTGFVLGALHERPFPGTAAPLEDTVDYRFVNGFTDVGDLPCRVATWDEVKKRPTPELQAFDPVEIRLPGRGRRLDFSGFWHLPTRLTRWARTRLIPQMAGDHDMVLTTCGGVHVWVDGVLIAAFEPFTRNTAQSQPLRLPLRAEGSEVVLRLEDMAERDTEFFAELAWDGPGQIAMSLPCDADARTLDTLMDIARDIRPKQILFGAQDQLTLQIDQPAPQTVSVTARVGQSVHLAHLPPLFTARSDLQKGAREVDLGPLSDLIDGYHPLQLTFALGDTRVERTIAFARLDQPRAQTLSGPLAARKRQALIHAAQQGEPRTGKLIALQAMGQAFDDQAAMILNDTLSGISARRDCSDFVMVPLLWLWAATGQGREWLPQQDAMRCRQAILSYRYWMDQPGNDSMWFWSENHVLCFHVSEYLAGGLFAQDRFLVSGLTGAAHRALATKRLNRWFDAVEQHGLAEWNSAAYYPIDFIGLLALEHLADDQIAARARGVLDRLFKMIALHSAGGVAAGSMGRAYDKELRAGPLTELAPFAAVAFGTGWLNGGVAALPMFCAGGYAPPDGLERLANPKPGDRIEARYVQGYGEAGRLALCKTASMQLSAAIDAAPGARGHQQHLVDVQAAHAPFARVWINHPGEDDPWGHARPSYWAGNGVMPRVGLEGDTVLALFEPGQAGLDFTHAYAPLSAFDDVRRGPDWLLLGSGKGWVALKSTAALTLQQDGPGAGLEWRVNGARVGWAVQIGDLPKGGLDAVAKRVAAWALTLDTGLTLRRPHQADLHLDAQAGLSCGGSARPFPTSSCVPDITTNFALYENTEKEPCA